MNCRVALIQADFEFGTLDKNLKLAEDRIVRAAENGAELVLLPESFNRGYSICDMEQLLTWAEDEEGLTLGVMKELAKKLGIYLMAPLFLKKENGQVVNAAVLISDTGNVIGEYDKVNLVPGKEKEQVHAGTSFPVFETKFGKTGILICNDLSQMEPFLALRQAGVQLILLPAAWRYKREKPDWWDDWIKTRARDCKAAIAAVNRIGYVSEDVFYGHSRIVNSSGAIIASSEFQEDCIVAGVVEL